MEKISAEIAAAEEAARKRVAEREKDAGDRGAREAPTCVLAEEEKHICATHGSKSQQNSLSESSNKEGEDTESNTTDTPGEQHWPLFLALGLDLALFFFFLEIFFLSLNQGSQRPQRCLRLIQAVRRGHQRTRRACPREPWRREPATVTQAQRPPLLRQKMPRLSHQRAPAKQEQPTESSTTVCDDWLSLRLA